MKPTNIRPAMGTALHLGPQTLALVFLSQPARYKPARHACPLDVRASAAGVVLMFSRFHASLTACAALSCHLADRRSTRALSRRLTNITSMATIKTVRPAASYSCAWAGSGPFTIVLRSCVMGELLWLLGDSTSGRRSCLSSLCGGLSSCFPCGMGRATRGFPSVAAGRSRGVGAFAWCVCEPVWAPPRTGRRRECCWILLCFCEEKGGAMVWGRGLVLSVSAPAPSLVPRGAAG